MSVPTIDLCPGIRAVLARIALDEETTNDFQWLLDAYDEVKGYYRVAAERGFAMILYVTWPRR